MDMVQRLGVEPSRPRGREGYSLAGVRPRLTLRLVPGAD
jgi:hypothetical protein